MVKIEAAKLKKAVYEVYSSRGNTTYTEFKTENFLRRCCINEYDMVDIEEIGRVAYQMLDEEGSNELKERLKREI